MRKHHGFRHLHYVIPKLKNKLRKFFGFSAAETNGLFFLIPLVILLVLFPSFLRQILVYYSPDHKQRDQQILQDWLIESQQKLKPKADLSQAPEPFDPNQISTEEWANLGFDQKIAERITKYKQKGGQFRRKEDLLKIYGINKKLVESYNQYLVFPQFEKKRSYKKSNSSKSTHEPLGHKKSLTKIDLNDADTTQLKSIRGIGPVLSARILKYREALGGFHAIEQLKEVYGIKEEVYARLTLTFNVSQSQIRKININQDSIKLLAIHPYLTFPVSKAIIKYRRQHGNYQTIEDLKKVYLIKDSLFQKIKPYLKVIATE